MGCFPQEECLLRITIRRLLPSAWKLIDTRPTWPSNPGEDRAALHAPGRDPPAYHGRRSMHFLVDNRFPPCEIVRHIMTFGRRDTADVSS